MSPPWPANDLQLWWADHTFNPWTGCAKVSKGCANCYAERMDSLRQLWLYKLSID
ncbi:MAG: DUF5131 family protein [Terracidiphilus sp.]